MDKIVHGSTLRLLETGGTGRSLCASLGPGKACQLFDLHGSNFAQTCEPCTFLLRWRDWSHANTTATKFTRISVNSRSEKNPCKRYVRSRVNRVKNKEDFHSEIEDKDFN